MGSSNESVDIDDAKKDKKEGSSGAGGKNKPKEQQAPWPKPAKK